VALPSKEEFEEWKNHFYTKQFFKFLIREAKAHRELAGNAGCLKDSFINSGEEYVKMMHRAMIYELIPDVEYEDVFPEEDK